MSPAPRLIRSEQPRVEEQRWDRRDGDNLVVEPGLVWALPSASQKTFHFALGFPPRMP